MNALQALALAKAYTKETIEGKGAIKGKDGTDGKNCKIKSIEKTGKQTKVTFEWADDDGTTRTDYILVEDGVDGKPTKVSDLEDADDYVKTEVIGDTDISKIGNDVTDAISKLDSSLVDLEERIESVDNKADNYFKYHTSNQDTEIGEFNGLRMYRKSLVLDRASGYNINDGQLNLKELPVSGGQIVRMYGIMHYDNNQACIPLGQLASNGFGCAIGVNSSRTPYLIFNTNNRASRVYLFIEYYTQ